MLSRLLLQCEKCVCFSAVSRYFFSDFYLAMKKWASYAEVCESTKSGGSLAGKSELQLRDVWFSVLWNPDKSINFLTSLMVGLYHWRKGNKDTEQLLSLFQFSKKQIYQAVQPSQFSSHVHLVIVQASNRTTPHLPYSNQYADPGQIGFRINWRNFHAENAYLYAMKTGQNVKYVYKIWKKRQDIYWFFFLLVLFLKISAWNTFSVPSKSRKCLKYCSV